MEPKPCNLYRVKFKVNGEQYETLYGADNKANALKGAMTKIEIEEVEVEKVN